MPTRILKVRFLVAGFLIFGAFGCAKKKPAPPPLPRRILEIQSICVLPGELQGSKPVLAEADQQAIARQVQEEVIKALAEIVPPEVRLIRSEALAGPAECQAFLVSRILILRLQERKDAAKSVGMNVAGVALAAVVGIGFISIPTTGMVAQVALYDASNRQLLWHFTDQVERETMSFREDYPAQTQKLLQPFAEDLQKKFPIKKPPSKKKK